MKGVGVGGWLPRAAVAALLCPGLSSPCPSGAADRGEGEGVEKGSVLSIDMRRGRFLVLTSSQVKANHGIGDAAEKRALGRLFGYERSLHRSKLAYF